MNADMKWLDNPEVFKVNQLAPHSDHSYYLDYSDMKKEKNPLFQSLNGQWEFFYCTNIEKQAKRWALTKKGASVVNNYSYLKNPELKILCFSEMTEEWLDFVVNCRRGKMHTYDIVEGPMADDQIWDYVEDYTADKISKEAFWALVKFKYPTHQIVFCTEEALQTLHYEGSITL